MDIIEQLYYGNVDGVSQKASKEYLKASKEEDKCYDKLREILDDKGKQLLDEFIEALEKSIDINVKDKYVLGFKTGLLIGVDCKNIEIQ